MKRRIDWMPKILEWNLCENLCIPIHDASADDIESVSLRLNSFGIPVNGGIKIVGVKISNPNSKACKFFTVVAITFQVWLKILFIFKVNKFRFYLRQNPAKTTDLLFGEEKFWRCTIIHASHSVQCWIEQLIFQWNNSEW